MREDMMNMDSIVDAADCIPEDVESDGTGSGDIETVLEKPEISEYQAAADTFHAAFNSALYEIETSRRLLDERTVRIAELNEAIQVSRSALNEEIEKGRWKAEEYLHETERLNQGIHDAESERDSLKEKISEQEKVLGARTAEIDELLARLEDVNATLEARTAEGLRAEEEFETEKAALAGRLNELQGAYDEANSQLQRQLQALDESNREISTLRSQVESLHAEVESRDGEVARLDGQVRELHSEIDAREESRCEQEKLLDARTAEIDGLSARLEDVNAILEARTAEGVRAREEFETEKAALTGRLNELQGSYDEANSQLQRQLQALDESNREISTLRSQVESLHAEVESRDGEVARLDERARELQTEIDAQAKVLNQRTTEIDELSGRLEDVNATLETRTAEGLRAEEEFESEKAALAGRLNELQDSYDEANSQLQRQLRELVESNRESSELRSQVESLHAEVGSRDSEVARLDGQVSELQREIEAREESIRMQAESHANVCNDLNAQISGATGELETLRALHADLQAHAEKLENLNEALHESYVTDKAFQKQQLGEKSAQIESLRLRLESTGKSLEEQPDDAGDTEALKKSLHDLEARLDEAVAQNEELVEKAEKADKLEDLNGRLRIALRKAREYVANSNGGSQELVSLHEQVVELKSALEAAGSREQDMAEKLQAYEAASETGSLEPVQDDAAENVAVLNSELERISSELSASEEKCRQLEAALAMAGEASGDGAVSTHEQEQQQEPQEPQEPQEQQEQQEQQEPQEPQEQQEQHGQQEQLVPDRSAFVSRLDALLLRQDRSEEHHGLMYVLLDNYMLIRDEIGLMESECVISEAAKIIAAECSANDVVVRFGDCTFAVLSSNATADEMERRADRIRAAVEARIFEYGNQSLVTTTSIGVCSVRRNDDNSQKIISRVDLACDAARLSGGNRVVVSSAIANEMNDTGNEDQFGDMVLGTLSENRIKIYYQPISDFRGGEGNHFEALVRLVDKNGDMILPGEFFAMAESVGYANKVDRFVIEKAMKEMSESDDGNVVFYIKLTRQSVAEHDLAEWIMSKVEEYGVKPEQLVLEISENVLQSDLKNMASLSKALHAIGCKVAIEHYRMSTNLQHLMHVHTDYLKIDKGLIGSLEKKGGSLVKVKAIMDLAAKNNYITIAEGVESPACMAMLWDLGVGMAQGYFIQVPAVLQEYHHQDIISESNVDSVGKATFLVS